MNKSGNPIRRVHVVSTAAVVTGIFAKLQKLKDVAVPGFKVSTSGTLALSALD